MKRMRLPAFLLVCFLGASFVPAQTTSAPAPAQTAPAPRSAQTPPTTAPAQTTPAPASGAAMQATHPADQTPHPAARPQVLTGAVDHAAANERARREGHAHEEAAAALPFSAYNDHPKLAIILIIDQFRGDYLDRWRADFKGRGFNLFLDHGAWFPECYYDYDNTKTAPGHATIGTGAYTDGHGISSNEWWDLARNQKRPVSSVEDDRYKLVGLPAGEKVTPGASPRNLLASTLGDELRLATEGQAEVFGVSLKDRAAILPAGATANGAFWIDPASGAFITSSFYMPQLPDWVSAFNSSGRAAQAEQEANVTSPTNFYQQVGDTPAANSYELDFAQDLIQNEQLGQHNVTDLLTISLSANDLLGHQMGPDSPQEEQMVDSLDSQLDTFFTWLDKNIPGGLGNVWIALTADHGVAPVPATAAEDGLNAAIINLPKLIANLNYAINMKFSPGEKIEYVLPNQDLPYISLNEPEFMRAGINEQEAEQAVQQALPAAFDQLAPPAPPASSSSASANGTAAPQTTPATTSTNPPAATQSPAAPANPAPNSQTPPAATTAANSAQQTPAPANANGAANAQSPANAASAAAAQPTPPPPPVRLPPRPVLFRSYTRQQLADGPYAPTPWGERLAHSYSPNGGWYVMVIPAPFQMADAHGTTHFTPYSYDRHVPLAFYGAPFAPGTYLGRVQPVDIASTFAALLGINQPSASVGTILTQALKPAAEVTYPRIVPPRSHRAEPERHSAEEHRASPPTAAAPSTPPAGTPHP